MIDDWQSQVRGKQNWQKAREMASTGTPEALVEAIRLANKVPENSNLRLDATGAIDQWSQQLLEIARSQSQADVTRAITIAKLIPRSSPSYQDAQEQIRNWRRILNPPAPPVIPVQSQPTTAASPTSTVRQP